jgi:hypothetical protein
MLQSQGKVHHNVHVANIATCVVISFSEHNAQTAATEHKQAMSFQARWSYKKNHHVKMTS